MIIDLKRSIDLRWLLMSGAIFISDDLVIADKIHLIIERCVTSLDENWQSEANESLYESCATTLRRRPRWSTAILKSKRHFDMKLTWDWHRIYIKLTQKYSSRVELFRFLGIFDIVSSDLRPSRAVSTGAYYPPVVTAGGFWLPEHPTLQWGHSATVKALCPLWIWQYLQILFHHGMIT